MTRHTEVREILALAAAVATLATVAAIASPVAAEDGEELYRAHRMFYDAALEDETELQTRTFDGQLRLAEVEEVVGYLEGLPWDEAGNRVGGWRLADDVLWSVVAGPSLAAVNVVTVGPDGTVSSAFDFDGDRVADLVDVRVPDGRRFSFLTERMGREGFARWLLGENPLCTEGGVPGLPQPAFLCGEPGGGSGAGGSTSDVFADPFDLLCAQYGDAPVGPRPPVMAHGGHGYGSRARTAVGTSADSDENGNITHIHAAYSQTYYSDDAGNHVATYTEVTYFDADGEVVRVVQERVDHTGEGRRTITDHGADGTTKTREETFEAEVDEEGNYDYDEESNNPDSNSFDMGTTEMPGGDPGDPVSDGLMAEWCAQRGSYVSGVEHAAATDPRIIELACDDLAESGSDADCELIAWAGSADFEDALATGGGTGCGPFEEPGPDGTCGATSGIDRLRGNTAWLAAAQLENIDICNDLACDPMF